MAEILHQLIGSLSHNLQDFIHPRWCRISSINSTTCEKRQAAQDKLKVLVDRKLALDDILRVVRSHGRSEQIVESRNDHRSMVVLGSLKRWDRWHIIPELAGFLPLIYHL